MDTHPNHIGEVTMSNTDTFHLASPNWGPDSESDTNSILSPGVIKAFPNDRASSEVKTTIPAAPPSQSLFVKQARGPFSCLICPSLTIMWMRQN